MAEAETKYCITLDDVKEAAQHIKGITHRTPLLTSASFNVHDKTLFFKAEAMQRTGSFKFRGATNAVKTELASSSGPLLVVTHSSGNHAQALALAAKMSSTVERNVDATIVMPRNAPSIKQAAVQGYGARVILVDNTNEAREEEADRIVRETGASFIHPSEDPRVIAGQGTVSLELIEQLQELGYENLDAVIIPVGGGGLAAGNAIALRGMLGGNVKIILAEPEVLDDSKRSFEAGKLLKHAPDNALNSVADGLKTTLGNNTWPIIRDLVDDIFTVSEQEILTSTKMVWERLKVCIEPSAGVGVAVAMGDEFNCKYSAPKIKTVAVILCGGNVDIISMAKKMNKLGL